MSYAQTAEFELASEQYIDVQDSTDSSTTYDKGELTLLDNCLGFQIADVAVSSKFAMVVQCEKVNALKATETMRAGQKLYWVNASSYVTVTDTSAGLPMVGYVLEDAASGDNTVLMSFDGRGHSSLTTNS